jgi:hypothetical protein
MTNIRSLAEKDLQHTLEGEFAMPVVLISPNGEKIDKTTDNRPLTGRVLQNRKEINFETGEAVIVPLPIVTLRISSLSVVPKTGEKWFVQIPDGPRPDSPMADYLLDAASAVEPDKSLGVINLPLVNVTNEEEHGSA